jgi:hypothetical protein
MIKYDLIEGILLHELADVLEMHSPQGEADELTNLKGAVVEIEDGISRLVDAIRFRGHDASIGQALDQLERERRALTAQLIEASHKASRTVLESHIENLHNCLRTGATIPEINTQMRLIFKAIVIDPYHHVISLTLVDNSRVFIAI